MVMKKLARNLKTSSPALLICGNHIRCAGLARSLRGPVIPRWSNPLKLHQYFESASGLPAVSVACLLSANSLLRCGNQVMFVYVPWLAVAYNSGEV